jgi:glycosyltransferase involved in cell wall biosynthesis
VWSQSLSSSLFISKTAYEIVIVDDASPDGTQEVAAQLVELYGAGHIVGVLVGAAAFGFSAH